jgi:hypothetical protein
MAWKNGTPPNRWAKRPTSGLAEELENLPKPEVLGTITPATYAGLDAKTTWISPDGTVVDLRQPPPWSKEVLGKGRSESDARTFVDCPDEWALRWRSQESIDRNGWNGWMPVTTSNPLVKLKVPQMRDAANNIRRGLNGDLLCFMPRHWWDAKIDQKMERAALKAQSARDLQERFSDEANRGKFGPHVRGGWSPSDRGKFPTRTQFVAKSGEHD